MIKKKLFFPYPEIREQFFFIAKSRWSEKIGCGLTQTEKSEKEIARRTAVGISQVVFFSALLYKVLLFSLLLFGHIGSFSYFP